MNSLAPLINGHRYSYASLEVVINGTAYGGVRAINYSSELVPGIIYGSDPYKLGRTPGKVNHECDLEVYRREWNHIMLKMGQSFGRLPFEIQVQYQEEGDEGVTTDTLAYCRVTRVEFPNEDGPDPSLVHVTVDPMDIRYGLGNKGGLSIDVFVPKPDTTDTDLLYTAEEGG